MAKAKVVVKKDEVVGSVSVSMGIKWGRPGFSSVFFDTSLTLPLEPGETVEQGTHRVFEKVIKVYAKQEGLAFKALDRQRQEKPAR